MKKVHPIITNAIETAKTQISIKLDEPVSDEKSLDRYSERVYTQCPAVSLVSSLAKWGSSTSTLEFV